LWWLSTPACRVWRTVILALIYFFVLSGFLITKLLVTEYREYATIKIWRFELRRMARLYPTLLLMLAVVVVAIFATQSKHSALAELFYPALYISNYTKLLLGQPSVMHHTWSLSVEAQFYVLWPFIIFAVARFEPKRILQFLVAIFLAANLWRFFLHYRGGNAGWIYLSLDGRFSSLTLGGALALVSWRPKGHMAWIMSVGCITVLCIFANGFPYLYAASGSYPASAVELTTGLLILASTAQGNPFNKILGSAALARIGLWSYSIYLWHYPIARFMRKNLDGYMSFAITLILSLALAALSYEYFERRMTKYLRRKIDLRKWSRHLCNFGSLAALEALSAGKHPYCIPAHKS
jgi:peptidoglycan/LPS O-acetylase OafA/YrhL